MNPWRRARIFKDALLTIGTDCETFTRGRCSEPWSGRRRDGEYGAETWCHGCIAHAALAEAEGRSA